MAARDRLFVSYAHEDWDLVRRFVKMLRRMSPPGEQIWWDEEIAAGDRWRGEIQSELDRAHSCLLFVSLDFLDSEFIQQTELPKLIASDVRLLPLLARDCPWDTGGPLREIQWLHDPGRDGQIAHPDPRVQDRLIMQVVRRAHEELSQHSFPLEAPEATHEIAAEPVTRAVEPLRPSAEPGARLGVPPLPRGFEDRPAERERIAASLLAAEGDAVGVTGRALGLHGQGGLGKSILAAAIAWDDTVAGHFPDGVAWVSAGEFPDLLGLQRELGGRLGVDVSGARSVEEARTLLADALVDRAVLLVADDVWSVEAVEAFRVTGPRGRVLYTTRDDALLRATGVTAESIGVLDESAARGLLAREAGLEAERLPEEADDLLALTDRIALAVVIAGSAANPARFGWRRVVESLREGLEIFAGHPYAAVFSAMRVGFDHLGGSQAEACRSLAVFPEEARIPRAAIRRLWTHERFGLDELQSDVLVKVLAQRNMVAVDADGALSVHDLLRDFLLFRTQDLAALHATLLDAYEPICAIKGAWASMPVDEPYIWHHLASHLLQAGRRADLRDLLCDLAFVATRIHQSGVTGVEQITKDCRHLFPNDALLRWTEQFIVQRGYLAEGLARTSDSAATLLAHAVGRPEGEVRPEALVALLPRLFLRARYGVAGPDDALLRTFGSHRPGWIADVSFSPDGASLAWASYDGVVRLWSTAGGSVQALEGHSEPVTRLTFTPDGQTLASASNDGTIRLWDLASGAVRVLEGHAGPVTSLAFGSNGQDLASASTDRTVRIWNIAGKAVGVLKGHLARVNCVAFAPDGQTIASGSHDATVRLWDANGEAVVALTGHKACVNCLAFAEDGQTIASAANDRTVRLWNLAGGTVRVLTGHRGPVRHLSFTNDGRMLASASDDRTVRLWDTSSNVARVLRGHSAPVTCVAFDPDGEVVASSSYDGTVRLKQTKSGAVRVLEGHAELVSRVAFAPDGRTLASASHDRTVRLWNTALNAGRIRGEHSGRVTHIALTRDGTAAASASRDGTVRLWDTADGTSRALEGHGGPVNHVTFSPDGQWLASASDDHRVRIRARAGGRVRVLQGHEAAVTHVVFADDGRTLASASDDKTVRVWDADTGRGRSFEGHRALVTHLTFSPDGQTIASASNDGTVRLWEASGRRQTLHGHSAPVTHLAFADDGRTLASGSEDRTVRLWNTTTGDGRVLRGHADSVAGVAFAPGGRRVASASHDGTVRLWDTSGDAVVVLEEHDERVFFLAFTPDGSTLASVSVAEVILWPLQARDARTIVRASGIVSAAFTNHLAAVGLGRTVAVFDLVSQA